MDPDRPLVRRDLRFHRKGSVVVVYDPVTNQYRELDEVQVTVLRTLDGTRSLQEACQALGAEGVEVTVEELGQFLEVLASLGLLHPGADPTLDASRAAEASAQVLEHLEKRGVQLDVPELQRALASLRQGHLATAARELEALRHHPTAAVPAQYLSDLCVHRLHPASAGREPNHWWFWRVPLVRPERFFRWLDDRLGAFVFRPGFFAACAFIFFVAVGVHLASITEFSQEVLALLAQPKRLVEPRLLLLLYSSTIVLTGLHEAAHGLACAHWGGRPRSIGLLFAYLMPGAYCDISSTYLIDGRWRRASVALAGIVFDALVLTGFMLVQPLVRNDSLLGTLITLQTYYYGVRLPLLSLNPFVYNDAYLALTDLLEYPNLRDDGWRYARRRLWSFALGTPDPTLDEDFPRRKVLTRYTAGAVVYTSGLLLGGLWALGSMLGSIFGALGLLLVLAVLSTGVTFYTWRGIHFLWTHRRVLLGAARVRRSAVGLVVLGGAAVLAPLPVWLEGDCRVEPLSEHVRAPRAARLLKLEVKDGQRVRAGDILARLDSDALELEATQLESQLEREELSLALLERPPRPERVALLRTRMERRQREWAQAEQRARRLLALGSHAPALQTARAAAARAKRATAEAEAALRELLAPPTPEALAAQRARLQGLAARSAHVREQLEASVLRCPADGWVELPLGGHTPVRPGTLLSRGQQLLTLRRDGAAHFVGVLPPTSPTATLPEQSTAQVRLWGLGRTYEAKVLPAAPVLDSVGTLGFPVRLRSGEPIDALSGMTGRFQVRAGSLPLWRRLWAFGLRILDIELPRLLLAASKG